MRKIGLRAWRVDCRLTAKQVADELEVDKSTIVRWENGNPYPNYPQLVKLCEIYDCTPDDVRFDVLEKSAESENKDN